MGSAVTAARFNQPLGLAVSGNLLYIVDYLNHVIKVMNLDDQIVSFLVGSTAAVSGYANGAGDAGKIPVPSVRSRSRRHSICVRRRLTTPSGRSISASHLQL